jgi:hypothetical protein
MLLDFFPTGVFYENNYDILCCNFLLFFPPGFRIFSSTLDFFHWIFQDSIHSIRCLSAQGGMLQHKYTKSATAATAGRLARPLRKGRVLLIG